MLDSIAPLFCAKAKAFGEQVCAAEIVDRINTIVGFYTRVNVDRETCTPAPLSQQGAHFEVDDVEHGLGIILWDADGDGYLETIEGYSVDDNLREGVDLADLKFVRLTQLG
jgi:hypothetical protein